MRKLFAVLLRLPVFVAIWALFLCLKLPTLITGYFAVPLLWKYRRTEWADLPSWTRPWSNFEDWHGGLSSWWAPGADSLPGWWITRRIAKGFEGTDFRSWYKYHAFRNGANGLRSFDFLTVNLYEGHLNYGTPKYFPHYEPQFLRQAGRRAAGYFAWQGWKAAFKFVIILSSKRHVNVKFGWRVQPRHAVEGFEDRLMRKDRSLYGSGGERDRTMLYTNRGFASSIHPFRKG